MNLLGLASLAIEVAGKTVCRDLTLSIHPGDRVAILGCNGVGKTTLLHTLAGLRPWSTGEILVDNIPLSTMKRRRMARHMGILFQSSEAAFPATVLETVLTGRHPHIPFWGRESERDYRISMEALAAVGMDRMAERLTTTLSGGELRRVEIAALMAQAPRIMLLDEPVNHLDPPYQLSILERLVTQSNRHRGAMLAIFHDINLAARFCNRFLFLFGEGDWTFGDRQILTPMLLERLFHCPITRIPHGDGHFWVLG
uniref:Iron complex transport system ATP-binding protein n=1 Tax=Candidatus Kentrum sp. UNK TaxID=2126344 RepID=A0A451AYN9_9GAMM|nr:MAG: iron complex transport system ATP-binding protein [Candidatus Kentron sp. UNK]VFK71156.1 MAG: iron complex transport system ATP-binding protein [Candidatus Kentron sp. UNK]